MAHPGRRRPTPAALFFPPAQTASADGIVAVGGDLSPERLVAAYGQGIFPWPHQGWPLLWFSPDPRYVLSADALHVPRRLERTIRSRRFTVTFDTAFDDVIDACASVPRVGEDGADDGTWITPAMARAYKRLHALGVAHSAETWRDGRLVGGLYGVSLGGMFAGESMFTRASDASKVAFVTLVRHLAAWGIRLVDVQVETPHVVRFGAAPWPRDVFLARLAEAMRQPTRLGPWRVDEGVEVDEVVDSVDSVDEPDDVHGQG